MNGDSILGTRFSRGTGIECGLTFVDSLRLISALPQPLILFTPTCSYDASVKSNTVHRISLVLLSLNQITGIVMRADKRVQINVALESVNLLP